MCEDCRSVYIASCQTIHVIEQIFNTPRDNLLLDRNYNMASLTFRILPANKLSDVCVYPISTGNLLKSSVAKKSWLWWVLFNSRGEMISVNTSGRLTSWRKSDRSDWTKVDLAQWHRRHCDRKGSTHPVELIWTMYQNCVQRSRCKSLMRWWKHDWVKRNETYARALRISWIPLRWVWVFPFLSKWHIV